MPLYVSAYDTEAVYPWWESDASGFDYTPSRIREFLAGVRAVADVHLEQNVPATFFLVARMLELAGKELRAILDHSLFDIQCHSFTHPDLMALDDRGDADALRYELAASKKLIEDTFGTPVTGLTAPGGYTRGFAGHPRILGLLHCRRPVTDMCAAWGSVPRTPCRPRSTGPSGTRRTAFRICSRRPPTPGTTTS